ncbi:hypothetical protein M9458_054290 [Cirrhinus mrigala]|uniref:Uncharacterized protein n=1 Tax=Cirrhinus mrigala TaxID=683832 RepID=A0ABD0MJZ0_CIRMR
MPAVQRAREMAAVPERAHIMAATVEPVLKMVAAPERVHSMAAKTKLRRVTAAIPESSQGKAALPVPSQVTAVFPESSQVAAVVPESSQVTAVFPESSQATAVVPKPNQVDSESSQATAVVPESSQGPAVFPESSQVTAVFPESSQATAVVPEPCQATAVIPEPSQVRAVVPELSQVTAGLHEPSQVTADPHEPSQVTVDLQEPSQVTAGLHEPSQVTVDLQELSQVTAGLHEPSQVTVDLHEPSQVTAVLHEPSEVTAVVPESSHVSAGRPESSHVSSGPEPVTEAVYKLSHCPVPAMFGLSAPSVMATKAANKLFASLLVVLSASSVPALPRSQFMMRVPVPPWRAPAPLAPPWWAPALPTLPQSPGPPHGPVSPPPHRSPGLLVGWSVWKPLFGGGGGVFLVGDLRSAHHKMSLSPCHITQTVTLHPGLHLPSLIALIAPTPVANQARYKAPDFPPLLTEYCGLLHCVSCEFPVFKFIAWPSCFICLAACLWTTRSFVWISPSLSPWITFINLQPMLASRTILVSCLFAIFYSACSSMSLSRFNKAWRMDPLASRLSPHVTISNIYQILVIIFIKENSITI